MKLPTLITYLEPLLTRESVDCKKYDYNGIQYTNHTAFTLTINGTQISTNTDKLIIYTDGETAGLLATTPHLTKYNYELENITTLTIT